MAGLVPAIHALLASLERKTWMPGTSPGMTESYDNDLGLRVSFPVKFSG